MQKTRSLLDVLHSIPTDLPIPTDDGACQHLENMLMLEVVGLKLIKRLTLFIKDGVVRKCFYPIFPPDKNVDEVIVWFSENQA